MKEFTILNSAKKRCRKLEGKEYYRSQKFGDAIEKITEVCRNDPNTHVTIYGGDGSVYEAVNAIMSAGTGDRTELSVVPFGTGNDFVRSLALREEDRFRTDLIKFNDSYSANMINIGFDCDVVCATEKLKKFPLIKGSFAYILGVVVTLFRKMGKMFDIEFTLDDGTKEEVHGENLLCFVANGKYCGGGFCSAPTAELTDGILDVVLVHKVSRLKFAKFVKGYRNGTHFTKDGKVDPKYRDLLTFRRCREVIFRNINRLCADGEVVYLRDAVISVVHNAVTIVKCPE